MVMLVDAVEAEALPEEWKLSPSFVSTEVCLHHGELLNGMVAGVGFGFFSNGSGVQFRPGGTNVIAWLK